MLITMLLVLRNDYFDTDTQNYHHLFDTIEIYYDPSFSDVELSSEWGGYTLVNFLKTHGFDFRILLAISAVSYIGSVFYLIYKYSENVLFSYFIYI